MVLVIWIFAGSIPPGPTDIECRTNEQPPVLLVYVCAFVWWIGIRLLCRKVMNCLYYVWKYWFRWKISLAEAEHALEWNVLESLIWMPYFYGQILRAKRRMGIFNRYRVHFPKILHMKDSFEISWRNWLCDLWDYSWENNDDFPWDFLTKIWAILINFPLLDISYSDIETENHS